MLVTIPGGRVENRDPRAVTDPPRSPSMLRVHNFRWRNKMPRPNIYALPIDVSRSRPKLTPIGSLTKSERRAFDYTARQNPHLGLADVPLLEAFAMAYCRVAAAKRESAHVWERENRILLALGTKLRVTQQATTESRTAARRRAEQDDGRRKPWDLDPVDPVLDDEDKGDDECKNRLWTDDEKRKWPNHPDNPNNKETKRRTAM